MRLMRVSILLLTNWIIGISAQFEYHENDAAERGFVYLEDSGYKGILVAIDSTVAYDPALFSNVYDYMFAASKALETATSKYAGLHFSEITLLLPQSWPRLPQCDRVTSQIQNQATFLIGPDTLQFGSTPHTLRLSSQCGQTGLVTLLPESFMKDTNIARQYGDDIGKTIVHEWAHYRYGVFDETTEHMGGDSCLWFDGGAMYPVKCSNGIQGKLEPLPDGQSCKFTRYENQPNGVSASLMYKHYLKNVNSFCDKNGDIGEQHNDQIPNPQNDLCDGKSVWEVIRQHRDFSGVNVRPKRQANGVSPLSLRCVQAREMARMVLTMDVSSSMKTQSRLLKMQQDVQVFIKSIPCRDTAIGLVEFSATDTEKILHPLVSINSDSNMWSILNAVPDRVINRTCVGCGIRKAIQAIQQSGMSTQGAVIVVFTDGLENDAPTVADVKDEVIQAGVVIYGILLLSQSTDHPLIQLAKLTRGTACVYTSDDVLRSTYYDCLESILHHRTPMSAPIQVMGTRITIPETQHIIGTVDIDSVIIKNALVSVTWSDNHHSACRDTTVSLVAPTGDLLGPDDANIYDRNEILRSITIDISGYEPGKWTYIMHNRLRFGSCVVRLLIEGRQRFLNCSQPSADTPVLLEPYLSNSQLQLEPSKSSSENAIKLYVRLVQGSNPVIGAQVMAEVQDKHADRTWTVKLWDNGAGADYAANDGIYSHYFFGFKDDYYDETYSVKFTVTWQDTTRVQFSTFTLGAGAPTKPQFAVKPKVSWEEIEPFQRSSRAIYFSVKQSRNGKPTFMPAKIADFKVRVVSRLEMIIRMTWTAVGEELDEGKAVFYDVRVSTNASKLRHDFDNCYLVVSRDKIRPKTAGEAEIHNAYLSDNREVKNETTYYIAIRAINGDQNTSPTSNVQMFIFKIHSPIPDSEPVVEEKQLPKWIWYALAGAVVFLLLLFIFLIIIILKRRRRKGEKDDVEEKEVPQTEPVKSVDIGVSSKETSSGENAPDILNEIQLAKANLKKQNRFKKREDGALTVSSRASRGEKASKKNIARKSQRKSIFSSLKMSGLKSSSKRQKVKQRKVTRKSIHKPWLAPDEPMQDHSYSNPLFGNSVIVPEVEMRNSVIDVNKI